MKKNNNNRNKILRIRYRFYRELGYSSYDARRLRNHKLDISNLNIKDNRIVKDENFEKLKKEIVISNYRNETIKEVDKLINRFKLDDASNNDTTLTPWGRMTHDNRFKDDTARIVKRIQKDADLNNDQAYYFLWLMYTEGYTYQQVLDQIDYVKNYISQPKLIKKAIRKTMRKQNKKKVKK